MATKKQNSKQLSAVEKPIIKKRGSPRPNNGGAREGAGRKPFAPTDSERKQVEALSGYGLPIEHIAVLIRDGINVDTLRKYFAQELISGKAKANGRVGKTLFQKVMSGDTTAAIWWTKTQMGWREVRQHELVDRDGNSMKMSSYDGNEDLVAALTRLADRLPI